MNIVRQFTFTRRASLRWPGITASFLTSLLIMCIIAGDGQGFGANVNASGEARATVGRAKARIVIDGLLNGPDWRDTPPAGEILQRDPHPGEQASEKTAVSLIVYLVLILLSVIRFHLSLVFRVQALACRFFNHKAQEQAKA